MVKTSLFTGLTVVGTLLFPVGTVLSGPGKGQTVCQEHHHDPLEIQPSASQFRRRHRGLRLPEGLTQQQREAAQRILAEEEPLLWALRERLFAVMAKLRSLSFSQETPQDVLETLGQELVETRDRLLREAGKVNIRLEKEAGFNPGWGKGRGCGVWWARDPRADGS